MGQRKHTKHAIKKDVPTNLKREGFAQGMEQSAKRTPADMRDAPTL